MSDWLLNLPVLWMAAVVFAAIYLLAATVYWVVTRLAVNDRARAFKAVSPGMLPPLGILFIAAGWLYRRRGLEQFR
jgi:hypothetical protein